MNPSQHPARPANPAREIERDAFNTAFDELDLHWHWDSATYDRLCANPCERERVRLYVEQEQAHLLRAYDAGFLADAVVSVKQRCQRAPA